MKEEWKSVVGYEGLYEVSDYGNIRSVDRVVDKGRYLSFRKGKPLKQHTHKKGYKEVHLCKNGEEKILKVHRLVAFAFIPNPNNLPQINHKDENTANNCVSNLEWCDGSYNINYGERNKRIAEKVGFGINQFTTEGVFVRRYSSVRQAAKETGIKYPSILETARCGRCKSAGGFLWVYDSNKYDIQKRVSEFKKSYNSQHKTIVHYSSTGNVIGVYHSLSDAHNATGLAKSTLMRYIHKEVSCPNGRWDYKLKYISNGSV